MNSTTILRLFVLGTAHRRARLVGPGTPYPFSGAAEFSTTRDSLPISTRTCSDAVTWRSWLRVLIKRLRSVSRLSDALATALDRQLENDTTYVDTAVERVRSVARLGDQIVQRGLQEARERLQDRREVLQRRQERSNLALTGLVGAILMALAAIQALGYRPPLPSAAVPAMVTFLGAFALLMSMIVVRISTTARAAGWALLVAAGLLGAAGGWLIQSWVREGPVGVTWAAAAVGAVVAVSVELLRRSASGPDRRTVVDWPAGRSVTGPTAR